MGIELLFAAPKRISFRKYKEPELKSTEVRVKTLFSGISSGTEMNFYRGTAPEYYQGFDRELRLFTKETSGWKYPLPYGYEQVGEIVEVGKQVQYLNIGDRITARYGHRTSAVLDEKEITVYDGPRRGFLENLILPKKMEPIRGVFVPLALVAFNGVLDASINVGEAVVVFGQGIVGQFVLQLCKLSGADPAIAVDLMEKRLELSKTLSGADYTLNPSGGDVALRVRGITDKRGADVVIENSGSYGGLNEAIRCCAYSSKVVALGWCQKDAEKLSLGKEFHYNRVNIVSSQDRGINPQLDHRWNHYRLTQTVIKYLSMNILKTDDLISHKISFTEAQKAFELVDKNPERTMQVVLTFENGE